MFIERTALFLVLGAALACSSGGGGSAVSPGAETTSGSVLGTLGGKSFSLKSGIAHVNGDKTVDVILSDATGLCSQLAAGTFSPGTSLVQAYQLKGTAPGAFEPNPEQDIKYATIKSTCGAGQRVEANVEHASSATKTSITITSVDTTTVKGSVDITFADGSSVSGSFEVPVCANVDAEKATCS